MLPCKCFCHFFRNLATLLNVALGGYQNLEHVLISVLFNLLEPPLDALETGQAGGVESEENSIGALVIGLRDGAEAFLPGCVPDLHLHALPIHYHVTNFEVDT